MTGIQHVTGAFNIVADAFPRVDVLSSMTPVNFRNLATLRKMRMNFPAYSTLTRLHFTCS